MGPDPEGRHEREETEIGTGAQTTKPTSPQVLVGLPANALTSHFYPQEPREESVVWCHLHCVTTILGTSYATQ